MCPLRLVYTTKFVYVHCSTSKYIFCKSQNAEAWSIWRKNTSTSPAQTTPTITTPNLIASGPSKPRRGQRRLYFWSPYQQFNFDTNRKCLEHCVYDKMLWTFLKVNIFHDKNVHSHNALCEILNFPPWLRISDGLDTAGEASDCQDTAVQCICEVVLWNGDLTRTIKIGERPDGGKSI